jgi:SAM-dependent methyltransferase
MAKATLGRLLGVSSQDEGDDWNLWWQGKFEAYHPVPTVGENAIELGCGPFTNMRIIARGRSFKHVICSDPLVKEYVKFRGRWLAEAWKSGRVMIDDHPLEECPFASGFFDLVVLINVLDHVMDSLQCLWHAIRITKPGGCLILGQDLSDADDIARIGEDVGHPIRIGHAILDKSLIPEFIPLIHRILPRSEGRNPTAHYGTYVFIGRKR